jgi:hypothetical protein
MNSCGLIADRVGAANPTHPATSNTPLGSENPSTYRRDPGKLRRAHWLTVGWPQGSDEPPHWLVDIKP